MTSTVRAADLGSSVPPVLATLARASTPFERIAGGWLRPTGDPAVADLRLARWTQRIGGDRPRRVAEILADHAVSLEQWRTGLGNVRAVAGEPLPQWVSDARTLLDMVGSGTRPLPVPRLREVAGEGLPAWVDGDQPWRFFAGFRDWLSTAAADVERWAAGTQISAAARRDLVLDLARRQLLVGGPVLMEAAARRPAGDPLFARDARTDWADLWEIYPVLGRLLGTVWRQWQVGTAELCSRIRADLSTVCPGAVVGRFHLSAGDQHGGGRGVARLELSDGRSIFLKPRADGLHRVLAAVLAAVDEQGEPLGIGPSRSLPEVVERDGYTWVREARAGDSATGVDGADSGISAYFRRAGALLRVLQALGSTDLHHENFVATADLPMLVDLETAIAPGPMRIAPAEDAIDERLSDSPGPTSMVTSVLVGGPGRGTVDIGALAGPETSLTPYAVQTLVRGADGATLTGARTATSNGQALPTRAGRPVALRGHEQVLVDGYREAQHRLESLDHRDLLTDLSAEPAVRLVPRATSTYARLLAQSIAPAALMDGVDRELVLERLYLATGTAPAGLVRCEVDALRELDIPLFTVPFRGTDLVSDRGVVLADAMTASPAYRTRDRLRGVAARTDHVEDLLATLFTMDPDGGVAVGGSGVSEPPDAGAVDLDEPVRTVLDRAIGTGGGTLGWIGLDHDPQRNRWHYGRMSPGLTGQAGIGLALAMVAADAAVPGERTVARAECAAAARGALLGSLERIGAGDGGPADGFSGPAGVLYAAAVSARLLGDPMLLAAARSLVLPSVRAARRQRPSVVVDARAGAILALLQLPDDPLVADALTELDAMAGNDATVDPPDRWARSLPSWAMGDALAQRRLDRVRGGLGAALPPAASTGDRLAQLAEIPAAGSFPATDTDVLVQDDGWWTPVDAAHLQRARSRRPDGPPGTVPHGGGALDRIISRRARCGRWASPLPVPDHVLLSPLFGMAAVAALLTSSGPAAPDLRTLT